MKAASEAPEVLELIQRCLAGDLDAAKAFQRQYGEMIYGYPIRVYRMPPEEAGDFYVFALGDGRIFRRLRTFEGRAPLRAYLLGFVLDDLVLEWKRGEREIEMVSMESIGEIAGRTDDGEPDEQDGARRDALRKVLETIEPSKSIIMKLLHIEDYELSPAELRYIMRISGRELPDLMREIAELRETVRDREATLQQLQDHIETVHAWIQLYERRLRRIEDDLASVPPRTLVHRRLQEERADLARKIERRRAQHARLIDRAQRRKVTAPYKQIAALLNTTVGNVGSQIARLRQELALKVGFSDTSSNGPENA